MEPLAYRVIEAARVTGLAVPTLRLAIRKGELPVARFGRAVLIRRADLEDFIDRHLGAPAPPAKERSRRRGRYA